MIIWGSGGKVLNLGAAGYETCATCEKTRPFHVLLQYRYAHLYYIFRWVTRRQYVKACEICGRGNALQRSDVAAVLPEMPGTKPTEIPFMDRYGWLIGLSVIFGLILLGSIVGNAT